MSWQAFVVHNWRPNDEVWALFFSISINNYEAKLLGHVTGVGRDGLTVRRTKPDHAGKIVERASLHQVFSTKQAADEYIAANPFSVGPQKR